MSDFKKEFCVSLFIIILLIIYVSMHFYHINVLIGVSGIISSIILANLFWMKLISYNKGLSDKDILLVNEPTNEFGLNGSKTKFLVACYIALMFLLFALNAFFFDSDNYFQVTDTSLETFNKVFINRLMIFFQGCALGMTISIFTFDKSYKESIEIEIR